MYKVYKITGHVNGKIYFGFTKQSLSVRFYGHWKESRDTIISRSIRKYGKENFSIELVAEFETETEAKDKEIELIALYKTNACRFPNGNGMNLTDGGEGARGYKHSLQLRERWRGERKGKKPSAQSIKTRVEKAQKPVFQFTPNGTAVAVYESVQKAAIAVGCDPGGVSKCCNNKIKIIDGQHIFQFDSEFQPRDFTPNHNRMFGEANHKSKPVYVFSLDGTLISKYASAGLAAADFEVSRVWLLAAIHSEDKILHKHQVRVSHQPKCG